MKMTTHTELNRQLPAHGRVTCTRCFRSCGQIEFDKTQRSEGGWRITANPLAWGNQQAKIVVLGFSKGPTQAGALATTAHNDIAYKGSRRNVGKILRHIGLISDADTETEELGSMVNTLIADANGSFHFGSLIRCTVERQDGEIWRGSGGGMLDKFVASPFGEEVARNCMAEHLANLPRQTKLVVMFGMGSGLNYVKASFSLFASTRRGEWRWINEVSYTDGVIVVVHVEHFASQGNLLPRWLGESQHDRSRYGEMAIEGVAYAKTSIQSLTAQPVISQLPQQTYTMTTKPSSDRHQTSNVQDPANVDPLQSGSTLSSLAEALLQEHFVRLREPTKYIATFRTNAGHHLAITRNVKNTANLWSEFPPPIDLTGIQIKNAQSPGQPYSADQPRNSNLNTASKHLGVGNVAYYLEFETLGAVERFVRWYETL